VKIVVTVPTYNEIENIEQLTREILAQDERIEVLVADDDSPDGTWRKVEEMAAADPRVHLLHRTTDRGRGRAGRAAFVWALEHGADVVFEMDADFSHQPRFIPQMLKALDDTGADVVLGSRQVPGGKDIGRPPSRVLLTKASNLYVRLLLGLPVRDCNSGFRGFRRRALETADVAAVFSPGPAIVHELLYKCDLRGMRFVEVPIEFVERELGSSTLTFRTLLRSYFTILRLKWLRLTGRLFTERA
jgi:dolichol-phosphate mannosyltransferase